MIECDKSTVSLLEDDILLISVNPSDDFNLLDYKEVRLASMRLAHNKQVFSLINLGDSTIPNQQAREACATDTGNGCLLAEAIIVKTLGQRIVARDLLKAKRKQIPAKLFTSMDKAMIWIKRLKQDYKMN